MRIRFITLRQGQIYNPRIRRIPKLLQSKPMMFHLQGSWCPQFFEIRNALCLLIIFKTKRKTYKRWYVSSYQFSSVSMVAVADCGFALFTHTPYSCDLVLMTLSSPTLIWGPCVAVMMMWYLLLFKLLNKKNENFFTNGIETLQQRWKKCVHRKWDSSDFLNGA